MICNAKLVQVIQVTERCGSGRTDDPYREVCTFWNLDGEMLFKIDPFNGARLQELPQQ